MLTASAAGPLATVSPVSPQSFVLGIAAVVAAVVAVRYSAPLAVRVLLALRWLVTFHRAGMDRLAAADTAQARRRARTARRTVLTVDDAGRVVDVTRTTRAR